MPSGSNNVTYGDYLPKISEFLSHISREDAALFASALQQDKRGGQFREQALAMLRKYGLSHDRASDFLSDAWGASNRPNDEVGAGWGKGASPDEWIAGFGFNPGYQSALRMQNEADATQKTADAGAYNDKASADALAAQLDAFGREMMGPLNMSDPTVKRLIESAQAGISRDVLGSGVEGGMANAAIGKGVGDAGLAIHAQRQALGAQVLGNRLVDQRQLNMYKDQAARMQLGEEYQNQLAGWESSRGMGQQIGGLLGAAVGGVGGFFLGGPAGAAMGASGGYGIGSGIGGSTSGGPPRAPVYNSPYYGYSSGGMSGGGRMGY